ncbi:MAG: MFS transporter [Ruminococcaceae bacterium]|nr:MFS transporter [Oscillospiraceae bacterium]
MKGSFDRKKWTVLLLFGIIGQIAWSVENMYFNLFVFETIEANLNAITLMVQLSGITATLVTLIAGTLSDKIGNRRFFISIGYVIWGITVLAFGFISPELMKNMFGLDTEAAVKLCLTSVIVGDCIMTLFGSTANDAAFSAWVTDNTESEYRGRVESIIAILPLAAMLVVAGGFGILVEAIGYKLLFLILGIIITASGVIGIFIIKDSEKLTKNGTLKDMIYGFKPSTVMNNKPFYVALLISVVYGIACQIFMPYLIIYMKTYLGFGVLEYSVVFGLAIVLGAVINIFLGKLSDKINKAKAMYVATAIFASGLFLMYISKGMSHIATLITFGISGFVMICGYIYISALSGAIVRDYTPAADTGKLQGVRMIFFVLIPMLLGPMIGNAINSAKNIPLKDGGADTMTTLFIPAPEIFLAAGVAALIIFALIPLLLKVTSSDKSR